MKPPLIPVRVLRLAPPIGCSPLFEIGHGMPLPKVLEWAKPALAKLETEMQQVHAHLPEVAAMFNGQNGSLVVAEGGIEHWLTHRGFKNPENYSNTIGIALPYRGTDGIRRNALVLNPKLYGPDRAGNTLAHELGHIGDVERGLSDTTAVAAGACVVRPKTGFHSRNRLFTLAYDLEETLQPDGFAAKMTDYLKASTYTPDQYRDEKFANTIGYFANHEIGYSPLLSKYIRDVFRPDMAMKAEARDAVRSRLSFALGTKTEEVVGEKLAPLMEKWKGAAEKVVTMEKAGYSSRLDEAKQDLRGIQGYMRQPEVAMELRKTIGAHMEQLVPKVEQEAERLERFSGGRTGPARPR